MPQVIWRWNAPQLLFREKKMMQERGAEKFRLLKEMRSMNREKPEAAVPPSFLKTGFGFSYFTYLPAYMWRMWKKRYKNGADRNGHLFPG